MIEITCRCGDSKKRFKRDIGPFFINECCEAKGYDNMGELKGASKAQPAPQPEPELRDLKEVLEEAQLEAPKKLTVREVKNAKKAELQALAQERGLEAPESATKKELVELILASQE